MIWQWWKRKPSFVDSLLSVLPWVLSIFVMSLLVTHIYWQGRFPYTHDGENHLARFANYAAAIKEGQFPPRFAPYVFGNFGFPVFQYNYPLANILSVPFIFLKLNPERVYALLQLSFIVMGALAWALWLRSRGFVKNAWWGVGQYLLSSYLINTVFFRGNIGEIAVYGLFPLLLVLVDRHTAHKKLAWSSLALIGALAAFFLAHNIFAVFLSPVILVYHILQRRGWRWVDTLVWAVGAALTAWFWFPALLELGLVVLRQDALANQASHHLLQFSQIFSVGTWGFGFSRTLPMDSLQLGLGYLATTQIFFLVTWLVSELRAGTWRAWRKFSPEMVLFAAAVGGSLFLTWEGSRWFWDHVPGLSLMQFPWRWLLVTTLVLIPWQTRVFARSPRIVRWVLMIAALLLLRNIWFLKPADSFHKDSETYRSFAGTTLTRDENRPITFTLTTLPAWSPTAEIVEGEGTVQVTEWRGSRRRYQVMAQSDVVVVEPTVYFPGWMTRVDGKEVEQTFTDETAGRVAYRLPARENPYSVASSFSGRTPVRVVSEGISLSALIIWLGLMFWHWRKERA